MHINILLHISRQHQHHLHHALNTLTQGRHRLYRVVEQIGPQHKMIGKQPVVELVEQGRFTRSGGSLDPDESFLAIGVGVPNQGGDTLEVRFYANHHRVRQKARLPVGKAGNKITGSTGPRVQRG